MEASTMVEKAERGQSAESGTAGTASDRPTAQIHLPSPSLWPAALGLGVSLLLFGVLTHWVFSLAGAVLFVWALGMWVGQMRRESLEHPSGHDALEHDAHP